MSPEDRTDGRSRILEAAFAIVEESGEAALRFADVAEQAGVALSVITHHFGTREGLLAAVHSRRFAGLVERDVARVSGLTGVISREEVSVAVARLTREVVAASRAPGRLARVSSIGATHGRPELSEAIAEEATRLIERLTEVLRDLQASGFMVDDVDPRAFAIFIQAYSIGMVLADLDTSPPSRDAIGEVVERAVRAFLL